MTPQFSRKSKSKTKTIYAFLVFCGMAIFFTGFVLGRILSPTYSAELSEKMTTTASHLHPISMPIAKTEEITTDTEPAQNIPEPTLSYIGLFKATAYCPCVKCCGIWSKEHPSRGQDFIQLTASGTAPEEGRTIAADWSVIPKDSRIVIDGQSYVVEDTGTAIKGNRIDIFYENHEAALEWGIRDVEVYMEAE